MSERAKPLIWGLAAATILFVAGIVLDLRWHATHEEFEGAAQQLEAHWLLWLGFLGVLAVAALAFARLGAEQRHPGFVVLLAASALYLPVTVWHFVAHANEVDPDLAHVGLWVGSAAIIGGAAWTLVASFERRSPAPSGEGRREP